jgi:threonine synthase
MKLYSTKNRQGLVSLREAVFRGLPEDNGLYMPLELPSLDPDFISNLKQYSFSEIAFQVAATLLQDAIPHPDLKTIIQQSINFPAPVHALNEQQWVLELYHGPSLAFKDFGARFMAQLMSYFNQGEDKELVILVATSGDTGGAVAAGFYQTPGIRVVILYPSGKVSALQEKQLTTLGHNIHALEIDGSFDDCQALVKQAFLDQDLCRQVRLSSANSINIARLIPQSFYYFESFKQLEANGDPVVYSVPSGNFGNLTAGILAHRMGLPVHHFIAATNLNDVVPQYLRTGQYLPRPSVRTLSNAMDVGNPSNFTRMLDLFHQQANGSTWNNMLATISGYAYDDDTTRKAIRDVFEQYHYVLEPHGAVAYLALQAYQQKHPATRGVILETAHPAKFLDDMRAILSEPIDVPERLARLADLPKSADFMSANYPDFSRWLTEHYA